MTATIEKWPESSGTDIFINEHLKVDIGHASHGYIFAAIFEDNIRKKKLRIQKDDKTIYYDMKKPLIYETIPLQFGSGLYYISLMRNIGGKKYENVANITFNVSLIQEDISFLYPNQYVNYNENTDAVALAENICKDLQGKAAYDAIKNYIYKNYRYDYVQAVTVKVGTLPNIDRCFNKKAGICQDLAALVVCMLRTQGIPAKFVIGYADNQYHAWVRVNIDGKKYLYDPTAAVTKRKNAQSYVPEREY